MLLIEWCGCLEMFGHFQNFSFSEKPPDKGNAGWMFFLVEAVGDDDAGVAGQVGQQ